ncbi:MAG: hypothetical protein QW835_07850 [Candidatus Hadarchaeum sp.]
MQTQKSDPFDALVGQLVKVVYTDSGGEVKIKKGRLLFVGADFIQLQTLNHTYIIRRSGISELRTHEEKCRDNRQVNPETFEKTARTCQYRRLDQKGAGVCAYHDSSVGDCCQELCPLVPGGGRR